MARASTGGITTKKTRLGTSYNARFRAYEKRRSILLGYSSDGWTMKRAEDELSNILADVRRGIWQPPEQTSAPEPRKMPTFHEFASEWFAAQKVEGGRRGKGLSEAGISDLEWRLTVHLLPCFAAKRLDEITVEDVDRYRRGKVDRYLRYRALAEQPVPEESRARDVHLAVVREARRGAIGPTSINKTLTTLGTILELALEYDLVPRNVAKGRRRRLPAVKPQRTYIDRADHIAALLDGTAKVDSDARRNRGQRRVLIATLVFAGLRIGELLALRWRDVDLARGTIRVRAGKTDAATRTVTILPVLRDELLGYRAGLRDSDRNAEELVFSTSTGGRWSESNVRRRVLAKAVDHANVALAAAGEESLPERLTPHSLRRTFASLLFAIGESPPRVMGQMGHTTPELTLSIYAREMDRRDGEPERLKALVEGREWAPAGTEAGSTEAESSGELVA